MVTPELRLFQSGLKLVVVRHRLGELGQEVRVANQVGDLREGKYPVVYHDRFPANPLQYLIERGKTKDGRETSKLTWGWKNVGEGVGGGGGQLE